MKEAHEIEKEDMLQLAVAAALLLQLLLQEMEEEDMEAGDEDAGDDA